MALVQLAHDFSSLFFPAYCGGCSTPLQRGERAICTTCLMRLPRTRIHDLAENRVEKLFWGRADVITATAFLHMPRKGITHHLIHDLKYRGNQEVGELLGAAFGNELVQSQRMSTFDLIIPVPLHPRKERMRGYNQCDPICRGLSQTLGVPWSRTHLIRRAFTESQTRKSRFDRWKNTESIFHINDADFLTQKHILLVDDVITTGATFEACAKALAAIPGIGISVAALAMPAYS